MIITGASCGNCRNSKPQTEARGEKWRAGFCRGCYRQTGEGNDYQKYAPIEGLTVKTYGVVRWDGHRYQQGVVTKAEVQHNAQTQVNPS